MTKRRKRKRRGGFEKKKKEKNECTYENGWEVRVAKEGQQKSNYLNGVVDTHDSYIDFFSAKLVLFFSINIPRLSSQTALD